MTVVTPTELPKSVRNCCIIEVFGGVFVLSIGFRIFCWCRGFRHGSESDLLLFLAFIIRFAPYSLPHELMSFYFTRHSEQTLEHL